MLNKIVSVFHQTLAVLSFATSILHCPLPQHAQFDAVRSARKVRQTPQHVQTCLEFAGYRTAMAHRDIRRGGAEPEQRVMPHAATVADHARQKTSWTIPESQMTISPQAPSDEPLSSTVIEVDPSTSAILDQTEQQKQNAANIRPVLTNAKQKQSGIDHPSNTDRN